MKNFLRKLFNLMPYFSLLLVVVFLSFYIFISFEKNFKIYETISTGVISGLITSVLLFCTQIVWKKNVVIWIENMLYQDVCIEGEWSGMLLPYIGLDTIDKVQKEMAWNIYRQGIKEKRSKRENIENGIIEKEDQQEAEVIESNEPSKNTESVTAEIVIHKTNQEKEDSSKNNIEEERTQIKISPVPIRIRVEIKRSGHSINGRIIEDGGASKTYSYNICGTFKNLILAGTYETFSKNHMDRGAFSLMLLSNGDKLEGFFSSYSDNDHRIRPMVCVMRKKAINNAPHY